MFKLILKISPVIKFVDDCSSSANIVDASFYSVHGYAVGVLNV